MTGWRTVALVVIIAAFGQGAWTWAHADSLQRGRWLYDVTFGFSGRDAHRAHTLGHYTVNPKGGDPVLPQRDSPQFIIFNTTGFPGVRI